MDEIEIIAGNPLDAHLKPSRAEDYSPEAAPKEIEKTTESPNREVREYERISAC